MQFFLTVVLKNLLDVSSIPFFDYDIALIKLPKHFKFGPKINPICLPVPNKIDPIDDSWDGEKLTIAGFGYTNEPKILPKKLQYAEVNKINSNECFWDAHDGPAHPYPPNWIEMKKEGFCVKGNKDEVNSDFKKYNDIHEL